VFSHIKQSKLTYLHSHFMTDKYKQTTTLVLIRHNSESM